MKTKCKLNDPTVHVPCRMRAVCEKYTEIPSLTELANPVANMLVGTWQASCMEHSGFVGVPYGLLFELANSAL